MTDRQKRSWRRIGLIAALAVALVGGVAAVLNLSRVEASQTHPGSDGPARDPVPVEVVAVATGPVAGYISTTANLVPEDEVRVLAETEGRVAEVRVEEGDAVAAGQLLAAVNRDEAAIAANTARLRASNASRAFERAEQTRAQGLISAEAYDRLSLEHEVARQEVAEAEWKLGRTQVRAPFAGRVTERLVHPGQHIRPGDPLFVLADFDPLVARVYLPERDVLRLEEGREVRLALAADETLRFAGRIRQISPVVDTQTGTVKVTVEAVDPPAAVRPGAFVSVAIVRERREAAALLPREAVLRELGATHVFVAQGGTAVKREVSLGLEENGRVEVVSGVEVGERVVVAGQGGLRSGATIKVL